MQDLNLAPLQDRMPLDMSVEIQMSKSLGLTARVFIQERARELSLFNQSIQCTDKGQSKDGREIDVNTVGRWLFGVPGYAGHVRVVSVQNKVLIYYPKKSPDGVQELISALKGTIETKQ